MKTLFGPEAKDGDYVLITHVRHMSGTASTYAAKVFEGKAYSGQEIGNPGSGKYVHRVIADVVIPEDYVSEENKKLIEKDIQTAIKKKEEKKK